MKIATFTIVGILAITTSSVQWTTTTTNDLQHHHHQQQHLQIFATAHSVNHTSIHNLNKTHHVPKNSTKTAKDDPKKDSVFGIISDLQSLQGSLVFIVFFVFLMVMEYLVHEMHAWCDHRGLGGLFEKLEKELMMMGILSFVIFCFSSFGPASKNLKVLQIALEFADDVSLFMAIAFVLQAAALVTYAERQKKFFLRVMRTDLAATRTAYLSLKRNPRRWKQLHEISSLSPFIGPLRNEIEFRIIGRLFQMDHNMPTDFNFANYVNTLFLVYLAELGEVSPVSWLMLAVIVAINLLRTAEIDPLVDQHYCLNVPTSYYSHAADYTGNVTDLTTNVVNTPGLVGSTPPCDAYVLLYAYVVAAMLSAVGILLYIISTIYVDRYIALAQKADGIPAKKKRYGYEDSLDLMLREQDFSEDEHSTARLLGTVGMEGAGMVSGEGGAGTRTRTGTGTGTGTGSGLDLERGGVDLMTSNSSATIGGYPLGGRDGATSSGRVRPSLKAGRNRTTRVAGSKRVGASTRRVASSHEHVTEGPSHSHTTPAPSAGPITTITTNNAHAQPDAFKPAGLQEASVGAGESKDSLQGQPHSKADVKKIFLFHSPRLYFQCVETTLLFMCFYISLTCTQLIPLTLRTEEAGYSTGWIIGFVMPMVLNMAVLSQILNKSVILRAVYTLDTEVAGRVCEWTVEERSALKELRRSVRDKMVDADIFREDDMKETFEEFFLQHCYESREGERVLDEFAFHTVLVTLGMVMSRDSFQILWRVVDQDISGELSWRELCDVVFPRDTVEACQLNKDLRLLRSRLRELLIRAQVPVNDWEEHLQALIERFASQHSPDFLSRKGFTDLLSYLQVPMNSERQLGVLLDAVDPTRSRKVEVRELWRVAFVEQFEEVGEPELDPVTGVVRRRSSGSLGKMSESGVSRNDEHGHGGHGGHGGHSSGMRSFGIKKAVRRLYIRTWRLLHGKGFTLGHSDHARVFISAVAASAASPPGSAGAEGHPNTGASSPAEGHDQAHRAHAHEHGQQQAHEHEHGKDDGATQMIKAMHRKRSLRNSVNGMSRTNSSNIHTPNRSGTPSDLAPSPSTLTPSALSYPDLH